jgi:hypothetical protein
MYKLKQFYVKNLFIVVYIIKKDICVMLKKADIG